ncbi:MAG: hypothetical protein LBT00_14375, partial [Spirochaetaceae bacterium]|nr:hypothetical protein [Spirochaetaceae bacterium]
RPAFLNADSGARTGMACVSRPKQRSRTAFPAPDKETGADENGTPSTGRPSFTVLRRRAAVFMSADSGARDALLGRRGNG